MKQRSRLFWGVLYPLFAAPVLWTVATVLLIFDPKPEYPPKEWAIEERKRILGR